MISHILPEKRSKHPLNPAVTLYTENDFQALRRIGQHTAQCLDELTSFVGPGVTTAAIDAYVFNFACDHKLIPATLNFRGYRYSCCTSENHIVCHGQPRNKPLRSGDILNIDVSFIDSEGFHGDTSRMYLIGDVSSEAKALVNATYESMMAGLKTVKPGAHVGDIGAAIASYVEPLGYSVVRDFQGHGIGLKFHEEPGIPHYGQAGKGLSLIPGMVFTVEPMINAGNPGTKLLPDGWTAVTIDGSLSAQFEHMLGVTENGMTFFTQSPKGLDRPPYGTL